MTSISVVIPCYNAAPFLKQTLESVWQQTHKPLEVLLVDDGSTDASVAVAESIEPRVSIMRQENQGESAARNRGMENARGDWIAFLDADDIWKPTKLERQLDLVAGQDDVVCVHTGYSAFGLRNFLPETYDAIEKDNYCLETLLLEPLVLTSTSMVRGDTQVRYPEWTKHSEDMIFFAELSSFGRFMFLPERLVDYRTHPVQLHRMSDHAVNSIQSRLDWVESITSSLGPEDTKRIMTLLREQLLHELTNAFWNRDWKKYWALQRYACTLDWEDDPPEVLSKKIYPPVAYTLKDAFDKLRSSSHKVEL